MLIYPVLSNSFFLIKQPISSFYSIPLIWKDLWDLVSDWRRLRPLHNSFYLDILSIYLICQSFNCYRSVAPGQQCRIVGFSNISTEHVLLLTNYPLTIQSFTEGDLERTRDETHNNQVDRRSPFSIRTYHSV